MVGMTFSDRSTNLEILDGIELELLYGFSFIVPSSKALSNNLPSRVLY